MKFAQLFLFLANAAAAAATMISEGKIKFLSQFFSRSVERHRKKEFHKLSYVSYLCGSKI
jgi:hypothetical protein